MRDFKFTEQERPTMANFNARFDAIAALANGLGNEYVWAKTKEDAVYNIVEDTEKSLVWLVKDASTATIDNSWNDYSALTYGKNISVNENGEFVLGDIFVPTKAPVNTTESKNYWASLYPFYVQATVANGIAIPNQWVKIVSRNTSTSYDNGLPFNAYILSIPEPEIVTTNCGYVNSPDPSAYPPAEPDGYTYNAFGQLGAKVQIATGSYTGTGTYGDSNPNSLTFDFDPKVVAIISGNTRYVRGFMFLPGYGFMSNNSSSGSTAISMYNLYVWAPQNVGTNTVSWHNASSAAHQLNVSGEPYNYIAIG